MNGACASLARRRAISVLPTPVGPIMRMFFGVISPRMDSSTCWRRQRLRKAIATARLAPAWPTMCRSSSETISCGVMLDFMLPPRLRHTPRRGPPTGRDRAWERPGTPSCRLAQSLDRVVLVRVDAQVRGDLERALDDVLGRHLGVLQ